MSTYKKYVDIFTQRKSGKRDASDDRSLVTDKQTYISFLEAQLEKVSSALVQVSSVTETTEQLKTQVNEMDTKLANTTRMLKLLQSFADAQEEDNTRINEKIKTLTSRVEESSVDHHTAKKSLSPVRNEQQDILSNKYIELEKKYNSLVEHLDTMRVNSTSEHMPSIQMQSFDNQEIQRYFREMENRIIDQINLKIERQNKKMRDFESKVEEAQDKLAQDMAMDIKTLEGRMTEFLKDGRERQRSRSRDDHSSNSLTALRDDIYKKIEVALNEVSNSVTLKEFDDFKERTNKQLNQFKEATMHVEKICLQSEKLANQFNDEIIKKVNEFESKLLELEFAQTSEISGKRQDYQYLEKKFQSELHEYEKTLRKLTAKVDSLLDNQDTRKPSHDRSVNESMSLHGMSSERLNEIEERISQSVTTSLDKFGDIIKKVITRQKELEDSVERVQFKLAKIEGVGETLRMHGNQYSSLPEVGRSFESTDLSVRTGKLRQNSSFTSDKSALAMEKMSQDPSSKRIRRRGDDDEDYSRSDLFEKSSPEKDLQASFGQRRPQKPSKSQTPLTVDDLLSKKKKEQERAESSPMKQEGKGLLQRRFSSNEPSAEIPKKQTARSPSPSLKKNNSLMQTNTSFASKKSDQSHKNERSKVMRSKSPSSIERRGSQAKKIRGSSRSISPRNIKDTNPRRRRDSLHEENSVYSSKQDTLQAIESRVNNERKMREEKIKKLLKKTKNEDSIMKAKSSEINDEIPTNLKSTAKRKRKVTTQTTNKENQEVNRPKRAFY